MRTAQEVLDDMHVAMNHADIDGVQHYLEEATRIESREGTALVHHGRGWLAAFSGEYDNALSHYEAELLLHRDLGDVNGEAATIGNIGNVLVNRGLWSDALEQFRRAYELYESIQHRDGMARMLSSMATVYNRTGDFPKSLEHNTKALQIHIEDGTLHGQAQVLGNIGNIYSMLGNYPEALDHMMRSLDLHQSLNDPLRAATVLGNIGTVYGGSGDVDRAIEYLLRALEIQTSLDNPKDIAGLCGNLGYGYLQLGDHEQALAYLTRALTYHRDTGNQQGEVAAVTLMIDANLDTGNTSEARALLETIDRIKIDEPDVAIHRMDNRGRLALLEDDVEGAQRHYTEALALAVQHELRYAQAEMHKALRDICQRLNDFGGYINHNNDYTRIIEEINGRETTSKLAMQEAERRIATERQEHQKHLAVLHSTLPKHIADRVARGEQVNDHYDTAAVIFVDIVGFTAISDQLPSADVVQLLDTIFTSLDAVCKKHDVVKIKTIGDSYMAVAFPHESSGSEQRATSAALDMLHAVFHIVSPASFPDGSPLGAPIQVRIGIHCGAVTAGVIGTERMQYDVWGDTVNVASRMENNSAPGRILVSAAFANALNGELAKERNSEKAKGQKGETAVIPNEVRNKEHGTWHLALRGETEIKGKGMMTTYWLERA